MTPDTLLLRQINPVWIQQGRVTSQAFRPTPKDKGLLSMYDGDRITARNAWLHFTNTLALSSAGVLAVSVAECHKQALPPRPDPALFPEHIVIDFNGHSRADIEKKAKILRHHAELRGWQYQVEVMG